VKKGLKIQGSDLVKFTDEIGGEGVEEASDDRAGRILPVLAVMR
jgi:hypothetical protein